MYFSLAFISPCSCFYFFGHSLFSLPGLVDSSLFFLFGHVSPCSAWPVLRSGLAALCLVSQLSVWSRGAVLRRLGHRRCECEFDSVPAGVLHPNSHVHCLSARGIEERIVSQSSTWLLVGKAGWLASGTRGRLICHLRQFGPPLCGPPHRQPSPRTPRMLGLVRGKNPFQDFSLLCCFVMSTR